MPELGGSYVATLAVAGGGAGTVATCTVVAPDGTTPSITPSGSGTAWEAVIPTPIAGWWLVRWTVTGAGAGVKSKRFYVTPTPTMFGVWPPCLADLKIDMGDRDDQDDSKDAQLSIVLDAAVSKVRTLKGHRFDLDDDPVGESTESGGWLNAPTPDVILGTIRLAWRWWERKRSPDGMITVGELGSANIPGWDNDIDRLLRIGRYAEPEDAFA